MRRHNWKQVLLGCASALVYFFCVRAVTLTKACHGTKAQLYNLSPEDRQMYAENHPQIAPEVSNGYQKQSYVSDELFKRTFA